MTSSDLRVSINQVACYPPEKALVGMCSAPRRGERRGGSSSVFGLHKSVSVYSLNVGPQWLVLVLVKLLLGVSKPPPLPPPSVRNAA